MRIELAVNLTPEEKRKLLTELLRREAQKAATSPDAEAATGPADSFGKAACKRVSSELAQHRSKFPALANKAYLNYGAQGPMPRSAIDAIQRSYEHVQQAGPFTFETNVWLNEEFEQTRAAMAAELNVPTENLALTENVSVGCNIVLWGIDWQPGDHLLLSDCENPGIVAAVQEVERRCGISVSTCPLKAAHNDRDLLDAIARHLGPRTRLIVLSHVLWVTGQVLPLAEIVELCRHHPTVKHPARILVDAAQSVGVLPLDLMRLGVDFYAFTGQKWWCGPEGISGLYIKPEALEGLRQTFVGWRSLRTDASDVSANRAHVARHFEVGTSAYPLYAGLRAALAVHREWGSEQERYRQIKELGKYLWQGLQTVRDRMNTPRLTCLSDSPPEAGIVSFQLAGQSHHALAQFLETRGLMVRAMHDPDCVRVCVHYLTLETEVDLLCAEIEEFYRTRTT
jgi:L-cysteine/cystine lyase